MKFLPILTIVCAIFSTGCEKDSNEDTAQQPEALAIEKHIIQPSEEDAADGSIDVTVNGGVSPYVFYWSNNATTENISELASGLYVLTIVDAEGSKLVDSTNLFATMEISLELVNESFNGASDGRITVKVTGGLEPITYKWSNDAETKSISNLVAGEYSCQISDASGTIISKTESITQLITLNLPDSLNYITAYKQSSLRIDDNGTIIYLDPAYINGNADDADIICTSHNHDDHMGAENIGTSNTIFVSPENVKSRYTNCSDANFKLAIEDASFTIGNITIDVVPAYNSWHNRETMKAVGYVITLSSGTKLYFMGDTGLIPEMKNIDCDIAFVPLGQTYTMASIDDVATSVQDCKAKVAIPIHYGMNEGKTSNVVTLYDILNPKDIDIVVIPKK